MLEHYAIIVNRKDGGYTSYFDLNKKEQSFLSDVLDNLNLEYDIYKFLNEVRQNENEKISFNYNVDPNQICKILSDFIKFVCDFKGHKIGVGDALINKFVNEKVKF